MIEFTKNFLSCVLLFYNLNYSENTQNISNILDQESIILNTMTPEIINDKNNNENKIISIKINSWSNWQNIVPNGIALIPMVAIAIGLWMGKNYRGLFNTPDERSTIIISIKIKKKVKITEIKNIIIKLFYNLNNIENTLSVLVKETHQGDIIFENGKPKTTIIFFNKIPIVILFLLYLILIILNIMFNHTQNIKRIIIFLSPIFLSCIISMILIFTFKFDCTEVMGSRIKYEEF